MKEEILEHQEGRKCNTKIKSLVTTCWDKEYFEELPWWSKTPPSNAGDVGSVPGWGAKTPHGTGLLSQSTPEPTYHRWREARVPQEDAKHCSWDPTAK